MHSSLLFRMAPYYQFNSKQQMQVDSLFRYQTRYLCQIYQQIRIDNLFIYPIISTAPSYF